MYKSGPGQVGTGGKFVNLEIGIGRKKQQQQQEGGYMQEKEELYFIIQPC